MTKPCALITSCASFKASELVKKILLSEDLPHPVPVLENICAYPWHIETKYYSADVSLCTSDVRTIGDKSFAESVQAFVAVFDTTQQSTFDQVRLWLPYLKELQPFVQILVCNRCSDGDGNVSKSLSVIEQLNFRLSSCSYDLNVANSDWFQQSYCGLEQKSVSRDVALNWCLDNSFELVELEPDTADEDDSLEDDFRETVGVQRIIEALSCHSWPNLIMKEKPAFGSACLLEQIRCEYLEQKQPGNSTTTTDIDGFNADDCWTQFVSSESSSAGEHTTSEATQIINNSESNDGDEKHSNAAQKVGDRKSSDEIWDSIIGKDSSNDAMGDCMDDESFEKLFDQLKIMKDAAAGMSSDERKKYAETVTMQFWQALGGNLDEFEGLSSDSD